MLPFPRAVNYRQLADWARLIVDPRNVMGKMKGAGKKIFKA